ncbi:MAG TPA: RHS repeat-associated core domain-containing protein [Abditibacteriaceae bacterium]|jgi:RHS repeat-associated protein
MTNVPIGQGGLTYSYDEANRLVQVVQRDTSGVYTKKSDFLYDGLHRKVVSREYSWISGAWAPQSEVRRVYDGMQVVQERDSSNAITTNYTRGSDLSGKLDGAGGIGGLLAKSNAGGHFYYHYDGSGNVVQLTSATAQGTAAEYTYDAFGRPLTAIGAQASQPYRFSTKEIHAVTGMYDYGFRFYLPSLGMWLNRDPIQEQGGLNLYTFVSNNAINKIDAHGETPLLPGIIAGGVVGGISTASWNIWFQLTQLGPCHQFDWAQVAKAFIAGFISGALLAWAGITFGLVAPSIALKEALLKAAMMAWASHWGGMAQGVMNQPNCCCDGPSSSNGNSRGAVHTS